jgi:Flp pilus assembly protein TadG
MIVALGVPALIGGAGLAVDFSQWFLWKRELQLATDQAAMAAAWARIDSHTQDSYLQRGTQDYYANLAVTSGFASTPTFAIADYANGNDNSIVVTATASRSLPFSSFIMHSAVTIQASSQATFAAGANYAACLKTVGSSGTTLSVGGSANVIAHCGMAALSCDPNAIVIDGSATVIADSIATCGTANVPAANQGAVHEAVTGLTDDNADLSPPTDDTVRHYDCIGNGNHAQASPVHGTYTGGISVHCKTVFGPGIYVIDGGTLDLTGNYNVSGTNVMFVLKNGATIKLGGSGNNNTLTLTPMVSAQFTSSPYAYSQTLADRYAGMLVFEDRNSQPTQSHIINGNSNSLIEGTIYLPASDVRVNGTADINSGCLQITAKTIAVLGNATLETRCDVSQTNSAGGGTPTVRLVA